MKFIKRFEENQPIPDDAVFIKMEIVKENLGSDLRTKTIHYFWYEIKDEINSIVKWKDNDEIKK